MGEPDDAREQHNTMIKNAWNEYENGIKEIHQKADAQLAAAWKKFNEIIDKEHRDYMLRWSHRQ